MVWAQGVYCGASLVRLFFSLGGDIALCAPVACFESRARRHPWKSAHLVLPSAPTSLYSVLSFCLQAAAFCYEELVLVTPSDHVVHCRLGEVYYTMGG